LIFIDDLGKENEKSKKADDGYLSALYTFFDTIYERKIQLVISSNFDWPTNAKIYGASIVSRFERICDLIHIKEVTLIEEDV
jgi:DNA replication protein DnaC